MGEPHRFVAEDKVAWCNNQIESWQKVLYNNEYDKVTAIENRANTGSATSRSMVDRATPTQPAMIRPKW